MPPRRNSRRAVQRVPTSSTAHQQRGLLALFVLGDAAAATEDLDAAVREGHRTREMDRILNYGIRAIERESHATPMPLDDRPYVDQDVPYYPAYYWFVLWRQIARVRVATADAPAKTDASEFGFVDWQKVDIAGVPVRTPLRRRVDWPLPIWLMFIGKTTPDVVWRAAETAPGAYKRRLRVCAADFYTAEYVLAKGARDDARRLLQSAIDGCPTAAPEATFAKAELQRLN